MEEGKEGGLERSERRPKANWPMTWPTASRARSKAPRVGERERAEAYCGRKIVGRNKAREWDVLASE